MKFNPNIRKMQEGGAAPMAQEEQQVQSTQQPAQPSVEEVQAQLMQIAESVIQQLGPEAAQMVAELILQMLQQGGGQSAPTPETQPAYQRQGGRLIRIK